MDFFLSCFISGVPVKPINSASGNRLFIAPCSLPDWVRWHSSTNTNSWPLGLKSEGKLRRISAIKSSELPSSSSSDSPSGVRPNLCTSEQISQGLWACRRATRSAPLLVRRISSSTPLNTFSICSSSSVRSVMISTRLSVTFSRIHLANQTMVRLLPLPWVCQMMPPSRRRI